MMRKFSLKGPESVILQSFKLVKKKYVFAKTLPLFAQFTNSRNLCEVTIMKLNPNESDASVGIRSFKLGICKKLIAKTPDWELI